MFATIFLIVMRTVVLVGFLKIQRINRNRWERKNPTLSDILYALTSVAVVYYWIHEFEVLNYRAGAETHLDAMISIVGIILSLEVCRRVLAKQGSDPTE